MENSLQIFLPKKKKPIANSPHRLSLSLLRMRARFARYFLTSDTKSVFSSRVGRESKRSILYLFFSTESSSTKMAYKKRRKAPPHDGKVTTADVYSACVEIRNPDSKQPSNYGHIDISRYTDIRIESNVPSLEHKPRWTKETKPKGFDYLKQLFEDRADGRKGKEKFMGRADGRCLGPRVRILCKRYGADGSYTPMIHSKIFMESAAFRKEYFRARTLPRRSVAPCWHSFAQTIRRRF